MYSCNWVVFRNTYDTKWKENWEICYQIENISYKNFSSFSSQILCPFEWKFLSFLLQLVKFAFVPPISLISLLLKWIFNPLKSSHDFAITFIPIHLSLSTLILPEKDNFLLLFLSFLLMNSDISTKFYVAIHTLLSISHHCSGGRLTAPPSRRSTSEGASSDRSRSAMTSGRSSPSTAPASSISCARWSYASKNTVAGRWYMSRSNCLMQCPIFKLR